MNLYTKIWLKLAPKGWRAVSVNYLEEQEEQIRRLTKKCQALWEIALDLRKGYNKLAVLVATTTKEVQIW